jgi:hypothetical protein
MPVRWWLRWVRKKLIPVTRVPRRRGCPRRFHAYMRVGVEMLEDRTVLSLFSPAVNTSYALSEQGGDHYPTVGNFGNGHLDLAVTDPTTGKIDILLGDGTGKFTLGQSYSVGKSPVVPMAAYLGNTVNGKAVEDLLVPTTNSAGNGELIVLLGNGDGTFQYDPYLLNGTTVASGGNGIYPLGGGPQGVAVADFGNGHPDIAVSNTNGSGYVTVLLGNGDGTFNATPLNLLVSSGLYLDSIAVGDFNGDAKPDLALTSPAGGAVYEFLNTSTAGTVSFASVTKIATIAHPIGLAAGNFGNSATDLAVVDNANNAVDVLLNNGSGTFASPVPYSVGTNPGMVAVGDFNGDGNLDLAVTNLSSQSVSVLLGKGNGTFAPDSTAPLANGSYGVGNGSPGNGPWWDVTGAFLGGGVTDIATSNVDDVSVLVQNPVFIWTGASGINNNWDTPANWINDAVPNSPLDTAIFSNVGIAHNIVNVDGNFSVGTIDFTNTTGGYTLQGAGSLTIDGISGSGGALNQSGTSSGINNIAAQVNATKLSATISAGTLELSNQSASNKINGSSTFNITGGQLFALGNNPDAAPDSYYDPLGTATVQLNDPTSPGAVLQLGASNIAAADLYEMVFDNPITVLHSGTIEWLTPPTGGGVGIQFADAPLDILANQTVTLDVGVAGQSFRHLVIAGSGNIIETGPGAVFIDRNNGTFTGDTEVQQGTLETANYLHPLGVGPGNTTIYPGAALSPEASAAPLMIGRASSPANLTLDASSTLQIGINSSHSSEAIVTGTTTLGSGSKDPSLAVDTGSFTPAPGTTYTILSDGNGISGQFAGLTDGASFTDAEGVTFQIHYVTGSGGAVTRVTLTVLPYSPTITTTPSPSAVALGTSPVLLTDQATLSGGYRPKGTITFSLYNGGSTPIYTDVVNANGDGVYGTGTQGNNPGVQVAATGTFQWTATYSGDSNNKAAQDQGGATEQAVVSPGLSNPIPGLPPTGPPPVVPTLPLPPPPQTPPTAPPPPPVNTFPIPPGSGQTPPTTTTEPGGGGGGAGSGASPSSDSSRPPSPAYLASVLELAPAPLPPPATFGTLLMLAPPAPAVPLPRPVIPPILPAGSPALTRVDFSLQRQSLDSQAGLDAAVTPQGILGVGQLSTATATTAGFVVSVGYVLWLTRNLWWVFGALSTTPTWNNFDPLAILDEWDQEQQDREAEELFD